jgi:hypothetical protein
MQVKTERSLVKIGSRNNKPVFSVAIAPKAASGHLMAGLALGAIFGFILGSVVALSVGDKGLSLAQQLWDRLSGTADDGEHVHFELLLQ